MSETDRPTNRIDDAPEGRYGSISDCTGRLVIYDLENADAWVRGDVILDLDEHR